MQLSMVENEIEIGSVGLYYAVLVTSGKAWNI